MDWTDGLSPTTPAESTYSLFLKVFSDILVRATERAGGEGDTGGVADADLGVWVKDFEAEAAHHPHYQDSLPGPSGSWATPPPPTPLRPPPSPTRQTLLPTSQVLEHEQWLEPGKLGRLAITLARVCVFGRDVMATGNLSEEGLLFIKNSIR